MAGPYTITLPIQGQPISSSGFGIPVKNAIENLDARLTIREALENIPDDVVATIAGTIAITATSAATLPSPGPLSVAFTNPSSEFDLVVDLSFSAWMSCGTSTSVQAGVAASGGMTWNYNQFNVGGPIANSDNLFSAGAVTMQQKSGYPVRIPAGAAAVTFTVQAFRSGGTTTTLPSYNYPTLRITPRAYVLP